MWRSSLGSDGIDIGDSSMLVVHSYMRKALNTIGKLAEKI